MNPEIITYPPFEWTVENTKVFMRFAYEDAFEELSRQYGQLATKYDKAM